MTIDPADVLLALKGPRAASLSPAKLLRRLDTPDASPAELESHLTLLEAAGVIHRKSDGSCSLRKGASFVTGTLELTRKGIGFLRQDVPGAPDIHVAPDALATAIDGDRVVVELAPRRRFPGKLASGKVVFVLKRGQDRLVGTFKRWRDRTYLVCQAAGPDREISVSKKDTASAEPGQKVLFRLVGRQDRLTAVVERVLGDGDDPACDLQVVLAEFDLPGDFPKDVLSQVDDFPEVLTPDDLAGRLDLRNSLVVTIDPEDAKDFDDAISVSRQGDSWELGVHIADVSHFAGPGSPLWTEALRRGTSVYLPGHTIHMLPERLSAGLCSLRPGEDRLTKSVFIRFDAQGAPGKVRLARSIIRSGARLTYEQAAAVIAGDHARFQPDVVDLLLNSASLAGILHQTRMARGALELELPEVKVNLDGAGDVTGASLRERLVSHRLIEEFMIAANEAVARSIFRRSLPLASRVHEDPEEDALKDLFFFAHSLGLSTGKDYTRRAVQRLLLEVTDTPLEYPVHMVALRSMKRAHYSSRARGHYALAASDYCHFTSPIRRFPDLIIGAILDQGFFKSTDHPFDRNFWTDQLEPWCVSSSDLERRAESAERVLIRIKLLRYLKALTPRIMTGTVVGVTNFGAFVQLDEVPIEGLIKLHDLAADYYDHDPRGHTLTGRRQGGKISLGKRLRVKITNIDLDRRELDLLPADRPR